jgi:multidrug resistance efflux pump
MNRNPEYIRRHLAPIPASPGRVLRRLQARYLPVLVFASGLVASGVLWDRWASPPTLVAEAETVRADVRSPQHGALAGVDVAVLQTVVAGQTLGHVITTDIRIVEASLAVLGAELNLMRASMEPVVDQQRIALDFDRLQLDWMAERVKLASLQAQLRLAESGLARTTALHQSRMVSDERQEEASATRDALRAQVAAQTELVTTLEPRIRSFAPEGFNAIPSGAEALRAAIKLHEEKLRLAEVQLSPVPLIAPIDGVVSLVLRRPGETITAGEPVVQITATRPERLVGFLRQPLGIEPQAGMEVEVRTRTPDRRAALAKVVQVGTHLEPISPTLLGAMRLTDSQELGLRVHVSPPAGFTLRPGEHVDVIMRQ